MSRYFVPLQQGQVRNSLIDFSPVNQGLNAIGQAKQQATQNALADRQMQMREDQFSYQRGRDQKQDARADVEWYGKQALAVDQMEGPQRAAAWQRIIARHGVDGLTPEELDPATGPKIMMAQAGQWVDPMQQRMQEAKLGLIQAQTARENNKTMVDGTNYGKTGAVVQGPDGKYYAVRYGADGTEKINPLQVGGETVTPAKGVEAVGDTLIDKATGGVVRNVGESLAAGEQAKAEGKDIAKFKSAFPKIQSGYKLFTAKSNRLISTIDRAINKIGSSTSGYGALLNSLPATAARSLSGDLDTIRANVGFEELQAMRDASPTGGALGQVSEMENRLLQSLRAAIDQFQSGDNLRSNLMIIRDSVAQIRKIKDDAYRSDLERYRGGGFNSQPVQPSKDGPSDPLGIR